MRKLNRAYACAFSSSQKQRSSALLGLHPFALLGSSYFRLIGFFLSPYWVLLSPYWVLLPLGLLGSSSFRLVGFALLCSSSFRLVGFALLGSFSFRLVSFALLGSSSFRLIEQLKRESNTRYVVFSDCLSGRSYLANSERSAACIAYITSFPVEMVPENGPLDNILSIE